MSNLDKYFQKIRKRGHRLTNNRIAIIEILENQHLNFKELQKELNKRGFYNVSSIYNNLDFLIRENIIVELYIGNTKYYDLAAFNPGHDEENHIHIIDHATNKINDLVSNEIFDFIKNHPDLKNVNPDYIRIIIGKNFNNNN